MRGEALKVRLMELIYEDFQRSIRSVREGACPETAFREHEARVLRLRMLVAALDARTARLKLVG